jgi:2-polyprenyl-6-methoxyphenol hydroxylase-like FAD-dependent oxidoreductase
MKITIIGGGPAGLYFALLMQRRFPDYRITVLEQNPRDATYGWGVVFSTISFLDAIEPTFFKSEDYIAFIHRGETVKLDGNPFYRVARIDLLTALQQRCEAAGVAVRFNERASDVDALLKSNDVVIAADGANSATRALYAEHFGTALDVRPNKFVWYGTRRLFDPVTLIFQQTPHGVFIGHTYRYTDDKSSFVAECSLQTWLRAGLDRMSEDESRKHCEAVFADYLEGEPLLTNRSFWFNCVIVRNARWSYRNLVLLGDAMRTGHPSIGAGTRLAMADSLHLFESFVRNGPDVQAALADYERTRRPKSTELQEAAVRSAAWYETVESRMHLEPVLLAYDFLMRTGRVKHEDLRRRDPQFLERYLTAVS